MTSYYDLTIPFRSLFILCLFMEVCFGGYLLFDVTRRKKWSSRLPILLGMGVCGGLMILYTAQARANLRSLRVPGMSDWLCRKPVLFPFLVFLMILIGFVHLLRKGIEYRRNTITRASIREGVDKITSGLCFYMDGGRIILTNHRMNALCFAIVGRDLQNGELFWNILREGEIQPEVERLSAGSHPNFRLPDGTVWTFVYENLNGIHQLSAADTTQIQMVTDELKEKNVKLAALNLRLRKHGENVDELTRSRERLETKARIHSELGQVLLSTRRFLLEDENVQTPPLEMWQRSIAMLRKEAEFSGDEQPLEMLSRIALSTGIAIKLTGDLPRNEEVQKLFVQAAAEALTNAISHAHAQTLYMELSDCEYDYMVRFKNDGEGPGGAITEGGGLGSLRKKIESEAGTMNVMVEPEFVLVITLPKERGELYDTGTSC